MKHKSKHGKSTAQTLFAALSTLLPGDHIHAVAPINTPKRAVDEIDAKSRALNAAEARRRARNAKRAQHNVVKLAGLTPTTPEQFLGDTLDAAIIDTLNKRKENAT